MLAAESIDITPTHRLVKVDKATLDAHWPFIRKGLLDIKAKCEAAIIRWEPEHIRFELMRGLVGQSSCEMFLVIKPDDEIAGFVVTTTNPDPFLHVPLDFFVWLVWGRSAFFVQDVAAELEKLARERGCTALEGLSPRLAWGHKIMQLGYKLKNVTWRKDLV